MSVSGFLKRNAVLVAGVVLPLLLVVFLVIARGIPVSQVPDPRYDLVFTNNATGLPRIEFSVSDGQLSARYLPPPKEQAGYARYRSSPRLYYLNVDELSVREIPLEFPVDDEGQLSEEVQTIELPQLEDLRLDGASVSPDGYRLSYHTRSRGFLGGLWGGGSRRYVLEKEGRRIRLTDLGYSYGGVEAVGWVMEGRLREEGESGEPRGGK